MDRGHAGSGTIPSADVEHSVPGRDLFRRLDAGSAAVLRLVKCSEGAGAPDSSRPWYPDGKTEDLPEHRSLWLLLRASDRTRCISHAAYRK